MRYAKAVVAALIAGLGALATALVDGGVEAGEWVTVAIATLTALYGVWQVPNREPPAEIRLADRDARKADPLR